MERVLLPLKTITDAVPEALQPLIAEVPEPSVMIALPVDRIIAQLPKGRVEVAIGQLRRVAPPTIFIPETDWDEQMVEIPLQELLPKLDPTLLKRRTQRRIDLPLDEDVFQRRRTENEIGNEEYSEEEDDFGMTLEAPTEEELTAAAPTPAAPIAVPIAPVTATAPTSAPIPVAAPAPPPPSGPSISAPKDLHSLFGSTAPVPPPAPAAPAVPPTAVPATPVSSLRLKPEPPVAPEPLEAPVIKLGEPLAAPAIPAAPPAAPVPPPIPAVAPIPEPAPISLKLAVEEPPKAPPGGGGAADAPNPLNPLSLSAKPAPAPRGAVVHLPLHQVAAQWPEVIKEETSALSKETSIEYPLEPLGALLKRGKVTAHWRELRSWIPGLHNASSLYDDALLELPLPIVAPLYMAASGGRQAPQKRAVVDESIPSPFTPAAAAPAPEPIPEAAPPPPTPAPVAQGTAAVAVAVNAKPMGALGLDEAIPATLIERACALSGVAGSVIALKDGLLVAARTPEEFTAETIAAFLPQVFSRVESAAGSMQIGEFQTLMFTAGDRPWQIWKAGGLFFAAIGRPNELLPSAQLKIIAGQLARQTQV